MKRMTVSLAVLALFSATIGCGGGDEGKKRPPRASASKTKAKGGGASKGGGAAKSKTAEAAEPTGWGTLTGTFTYDGDAPERALVSVDKDGDFCGTFGLRDESLVVNPDNKGISGVFVYLRTKTSHHESYDQLKDTPVEFSNRNCTFAPHAIGIWLPQTLMIKNEDSVTHNTNITARGDNQGSSNVMQPPNSSHENKFTRSQNEPVQVACSYHKWMSGYVLPRDNPYFAVTDENGQFTIENVPAGIELEFQVWQEKAGRLTAKSDWNNGRFKVTLEPDQAMDMGAINVAPVHFNQ